ncbi:MAG: DUF4190 domain-containing protein [Candidatus Thalassarchaeaceae archaeon]|jgi:magnesium-transporting ATPase (P-type)|nr:DUF4190 domain-containing protein [Candidatus Thalassarchaeaceae archaeon]
MDEEDAPPETNVISGEAQPESQTEVLYVQGMSNPMNVGQYPQTQATIALVLSIVGLMGFSCCTAIPGVIMANSALEITKQNPGHPDQGLANAAKIIGWISIGLTIAFVGLYLFIIIIAVAASA